MFRFIRKHKQQHCYDDDILKYGPGRNCTPRCLGKKCFFSLRPSHARAFRLSSHFWIGNWSQGSDEARLNKDASRGDLLPKRSPTIALLPKRSTPIARSPLPTPAFQSSSGPSSPADDKDPETGFGSEFVGGIGAVNEKESENNRSARWGKKISLTWD